MTYIVVTPIYFPFHFHHHLIIGSLLSTETSSNSISHASISANRCFSASSPALGLFSWAVDEPSSPPAFPLSTSASEQSPDETPRRFSLSAARPLLSVCRRREAYIL